LLKEQEEGVPYRLSDLPENHPARRFARQVNQQRSSGLCVCAARQMYCSSTTPDTSR
jgi:hypothetical protein